MIPEIFFFKSVDENRTFFKHEHTQDPLARTRVKMGGKAHTWDMAFYCFLIGRL